MVSALPLQEQVIYERRTAALTAVLMERGRENRPLFVLRKAAKTGTILDDRGQKERCRAGGAKREKGPKRNRKTSRYGAEQ